MLQILCYFLPSESSSSSRLFFTDSQLPYRVRSIILFHFGLSLCPSPLSPHIHLLKYFRPFCRLCNFTQSLISIGNSSHSLSCPACSSLVTVSSFPCFLCCVYSSLLFAEVLFFILHCLDIPCQFIFHEILKTHPINEHTCYMIKDHKKSVR